MSAFLYNSQSMLWGTTLCIQDRQESDLTKSRFDFDWQGRNQQVTRIDQYHWASRWPRSRLMGGDPSNDYILGVDASEGGKWEPMNFADTGAQRLFFIRGVCVDGSGAPLAAAVLEMYLSVDNTFVSSGTTDSNGIYSLGTPFTGQNHTIVANYGPNTLTGSSVDTLQPVSSPW